MNTWGSQSSSHGRCLSQDSITQSGTSTGRSNKQLTTILVIVSIGDVADVHAYCGNFSTDAVRDRHHCHHHGRRHHCYRRHHHRHHTTAAAAAPAAAAAAAETSLIMRKAQEKTGIELHFTSMFINHNCVSHGKQ